MKQLLLMMVCLGSLAQAKTTELPAVEVSANVIEGTVLMIKMKHPLVIPKDQQLALDKELGESQRNQLYVDMVMEKGSKQIAAQYQNAKRPITAQVIKQYDGLMLGSKKANRLGSM